MYCISDQQIDFILNDIRARGVKMDSLQQDILDHVCCIIEQNLEESGDFEAFYLSIISRFYKKELREIEEETISLLNNKHFYTMKKVMINSGTFAAAVLSLGIALKFTHSPGAAVCIVLGIFALSFIFLPLMFILRVKEQSKTSDKVSLVLGAIAGTLVCLSTLFKVQHWPGANIMGVLAIGILVLLFLPIYFISGVKQPEKKTNTIVTSILVLSGCGLLLTLVISPWGVRAINVGNTLTYLRNEQVLENEQKQVWKQVHADSAHAVDLKTSEDIVNKCEDLKAWFIEYETGVKKIDTGFASKNTLLSDALSNFQEDGVWDKIKDLTKEVQEYNVANEKLGNKDLLQIPVNNTILNRGGGRTMECLSDLMHIEMIVLQNERAMVCIK